MLMTRPEAETEPTVAEKPIEWNYEFKGGADTPFVFAIKILAKEYPEFQISLEERQKDSGEKYQVAYGTEAGRKAFLTVCGDDVFKATFALWEVGSRLKSTGGSIVDSDLWQRSLANFEETYQKISGKDHFLINFARFTRKLQHKPEDIFYRIIKGVVERKKGMFITGVRQPGL